MYSKLSKKSVFLKIINLVVLSGFILTGVPIRSYADVFAAKSLRKIATEKDPDGIDKISLDLAVKDYKDKVVDLRLNGMPTIFAQLEKIYKDRGAGMDDYYVPGLVVVDSKGEPAAKIKKGDVVIFTNHRSDRALETLYALTDPDFNKRGNRFDTEDLRVTFVPFANYDDAYFRAAGIQAAFTSKFTLPPYKSIVEVLHQAGVIQGYFTESDKGQHPTYFFAGQRNLDYASLGIKVSIVPSESVEDKNKSPLMKYDEIADNVINYLNEIKGIHKKKVIVVNLPVDIQGHNIKGNKERAKQTVLAADKAAGIIREAALSQKGIYIDTSDHGNIEQLAALSPMGMPLSDKYGVIPFDEHTTNPVNFIIDGIGKNIKLKDGKGLSNIAATLLEILGIPKPEEMDESMLLDYKYKETEETIVLLLRDGWGVNPFKNQEAKEYNGIELAQPPVFLGLINNSPHKNIKAHGDAIGLPDYQMGDSDNGHRVIGTGFNPPTLYKQIIDQIENGTFFQNPVLLRAFESAEKEKRDIHIIGLYSSGGIHSDNRFFLALMEMAKKVNFKGKVNIWPILDGRDVMTRIPTESGIFYLKQIQDKILELGLPNIQIAGVVGRNFAMDRDAINLDRDADKTEKLAAQKDGLEAEKLLKEAASSREKAQKIWQERFKVAYGLWVNGEGIPVRIDFDGGIEKIAEELKADVKETADFFYAHSRIFKLTGGETLYREYLKAVLEWYKTLRRQSGRSADKGLALLVHSGFFKNGAALDALKEVIGLELDGRPVVTLGIYGEGAGKVKALFGDDADVITADTVGELKPEIEKRVLNFGEDVLVLKPLGQKIDLKVRQVAYSEKTLSTVTVSKAVEVLMPRGADQDYSGVVSSSFEKFYARMEEEKIIPPETYKNTIEQVYSQLTLPDIELIQTIAEKIEKDASAVAEFVEKFL